MLRFLLFLFLLSPALADAQTVSRGVVLSVDPSYTVGSDHPLRLDTTGKLQITGSVTASGASAVAPVVSSAAEGSHVLKSSAGSLIAFIATSGASAGYVLLFDATSAPADGVVTPVECLSIPATSTLGFSAPTPVTFATGITIVFSTTGCFSKTISATAFFSAQVQ